MRLGACTSAVPKEIFAESRSQSLQLSNRYSASASGNGLRRIKRCSRSLRVLPSALGSIQGGPNTASQRSAAKLASVLEGAQVVVVTGDRVAKREEEMVKEDPMWEPIDGSVEGWILRCGSPWKSDLV